MTVCDKAIRLIRALLWAVVCLGLPMALEFGVNTLWVIANGLDGAGLALCLEAAMDLLPMGGCTAIAVTTVLRLKGRALPKWWWLGLTGMLAGAWAMRMTTAAPSGFPGQNTAALMGSAAMLLLHALWSLLANGETALHKASTNHKE